MFLVITNWSGLRLPDWHHAPLQSFEIHLKLLNLIHEPARYLGNLLNLCKWSNKTKNKKRNTRPF